MGDVSSITITGNEDGGTSNPGQAEPQIEGQVSQQPDPVDLPATAATEAGEATPSTLQIDKPEPTDFFSDENYSRLMNDVVANGGTFTEENYAEFEKAGYPKAIADRLLAAEITEATARTNQAIEAVGGMEAADAALRWAAENLSPEEQAAFNAQLGSRDVGVATAALRTLVAQSGASAGTVAATTGANMANHYRDESEFEADMRDPRIDKSPAFREEVMAKLARSHQMGTIRVKGM